MKRVLSICLICCLLILTGCQKSPSTDVVISKNNPNADKEIVSDSDITRTTSTNGETFVCTDNFKSTDGTVSFSVDIAQQLRDGDMPIVEIAPYYLTADDAKRVASVLFGDCECYEADPLFAPNFTQQEIQERITRWTGYTNAQAIGDLYGEADSHIAELVKETISEFTTMYESAQVENTDAKCQWTFKKDSYYLYSPENITNSETVDDNDAIMARYKIGDVYYSYEVVTRNQKDFKLNMIQAYLFDGPGPMGIDERIFQASLCRTNEPTESQVQQIKERASVMIKQFDLGDWEITECNKQTSWWGSTPEYVIRINAVPKFQEVAAIHQPQLTNLNNETVYSSNYYLSEMSFEFSANGDLVHFTLTSPYEVKQTISNKATVIGMNELIQKMKLHLSHSDYYEYGMGYMIPVLDEDLLCNVTINRFEYGLLRTKVAETEENYYYVPGVVFYGDIEYIGKDSNNLYYQNDDMRALVAFNAVDGTVVPLSN